MQEKHRINQLTIRKNKEIIYRFRQYQKAKIK